nr:HypC/HybG/HupF family hydrogenase formation chaperone [uncultured Cohaesibacter sp.]
MCLGIPGQIVEIIDEDRKLAMIDISGVRRSVSVACVAGNRPLAQLVGAWTLVHVGFAMSLIDEAEAAETLRTLNNMGEVGEELAAIHATEAMMGAHG